MYLRDLRKSLLRRWYLVLLGLVLTAGLGVFSWQAIPATYEAKGSILLLPPKSSVKDDGNPYLYLGGLGQAGDVLTRTLNADAAQRSIKASHPTSTYTITPDTTTTGPILLVTVESDDAADSLATVKSVLDLVPGSLLKLQDDLAVQENSRITSMVLAVDAKATPVTKTRQRAVIGVVAVGLAGTLLLTGLIDGVLTRRRRKKESVETDLDDLDGLLAAPTVSQPQTRRTRRSSAAAEPDDVFVATPDDEPGAQPSGRRTRRAHASRAVDAAPNARPPQAVRHRRRLVDSRSAQDD